MVIEFEYEEETREGPFVNRVDETKEFTERLDIVTGGWIYHPALAVYSLVFSPEWQQLTEKTSSGPSSVRNTSDSFLQGYDAELVVFPYKPYTLTLFAKKERDILNNNFSGRTTEEGTSYGSQIALKSGFLPTTFSYTHSESQTSGFYSADRNQDQYRMVSSNLSKFGNIRLSGYYTQRDDTVNDVGIDSKQQVYTFSHTRSFLDNNTVILNSSLTYTDTVNNNVLNRNFLAIENLSWRHKENLRTQYTFLYRDRELDDPINATQTDDDMASGNFNLTHFLYENLTTNVNTGATRTRNNGNKEVTYNGGVDFRYSRDLPVGSLQADMGQDITLTEVNYSSDFNRMINEAVSLVSTFTELKNENIDVTSIVVTDSTGTIYPEAGNYVLSTLGTVTRIRCITGGLLDTVLNCSAGAPVLIDYDYRVRFPFDYWIHAQSYGVNLNLYNALNMYYRFVKSKQYFLRGIQSSTDELINDRSHSVGMLLKMNWSETEIAYENRKSTTRPLEKASVREIITVQPSYYSIIRCSLGYTTTNDKLRNETEKLTDVLLSYEKVIGSRAKVSANGFYQRLSSPSLSFEDRSIRVALDWFYRIYKGRITYSYTEEEDHIVQQIMKNNYILFSLNRKLF